MSKIILLLILGALGYVAYRRWVAPVATPQRGDDAIPEANWTPVDTSAAASSINESCAADTSDSVSADCGSDGGGGGSD